MSTPENGRVSVLVRQKYLQMFRAKNVGREVASGFRVRRHHFLVLRHWKSRSTSLRLVIPQLFVEMKA